MRWLDRAVSVFFPRAAMRRVAARIALDRLMASYDGARHTRRTRNWRAPTSGPNAAIGSAAATLRARIRDLVRNNPWAAAAIDVRVAFEVGYGIQAKSATGDVELDARVDELWRAWCRVADAGGRLTFDGLLAQLARMRLEAGEGLWVLLTPPPAEARARSLPVPLLVQAVEPDLLSGDAELTRRAATDARVVQGVELDAVGRPLAYHLLASHPGENNGIGAFGETRRIEAPRVIHLFVQHRPGQVRGVSDLAPVITRIRGLDELEDAALETAKVQACLAAFVTSPAEAGFGPLEAPAQGMSGEQVKTFSPGMVERLMPGESVDFVAPSGQSPFSDLARHHLHAIAAAVGLTYDLLTGDLSDANYSSLRAGRIAFKRRLEAFQWQVLIPHVCDRVWRAFINAAVASGALPLRPEGYPVEWTPPRFEMVDPLKDTAALKEMVRCGFMTWAQAVGELGYDAGQQLAEIARWNTAFDNAGLILDVDPRRMARSGVAQDVRQNAAVELAAEEAAQGDGA